MLTLKELAFALDTTPEGLAPATSKKKITFDHFQAKKLLKTKYLYRSPHFVTIAALKGGIGKTFLSTHIAVRLSQLGHRVLILDLDPEACASNSLLTEKQIDDKGKSTILEVIKGLVDFKDALMETKYPGLDILPASLRISKCEKNLSGKNPKTLLKKMVSDLPYEFIFFELAPSFSTLSASAYLSSDLIIIPCVPNIHSLESVDLTIEAVKEVAEEFEVPNIAFKILLNMFNSKRNASQDVLNFLLNDYPHLLLPFRIKESAEYQNAINEGVTIFETNAPIPLKREFDKLIRILFPLKKKESSIPLTRQ